MSDAFVRRVAWVFAAVVMVSAIVIGLIWSTSDARQLEEIQIELARDDIAHRQRALWHLGSVEHPRAEAIATELLASAKEYHIREAAAYALHKMEHVDSFDRLRVAAEKEPFGWARAKMITYAARVGGKDALAWLKGLATDEPSWQDLGAAIGRTELGDYAAGATVIGYLRSADEGMRSLAVHDVTDWVRDMSEAIGRPVGLPPEGQPLSAEQIEGVIGWWNDHVTPKLLQDNVAWSKHEHPLWHRVRKLMRNRERALRTLNIG